MRGCGTPVANVVEMSAVDGWNRASADAVFYVCAFHGLALGEDEAFAMGKGGATISLGTDAPASFIRPFN